MGGWDRWGLVDLYEGVSGGTGGGGGYYLIAVGSFSSVLLSFVLTSSVSFF